MQWGSFVRQGPQTKGGLARFNAFQGFLKLGCAPPSANQRRRYACSPFNSFCRGTGILCVMRRDEQKVCLRSVPKGSEKYRVSRSVCAAISRFQNNDARSLRAMASHCLTPLCLVFQNWPWLLNLEPPAFANSAGPARGWSRRYRAALRTEPCSFGFSSRGRRAGTSSRNLARRTQHIERVAKLRRLCQLQPKVSAIFFRQSKIQFIEQLLPA